MAEDGHSAHQGVMLLHNLYDDCQEGCLGWASHEEVILHYKLYEVLHPFTPSCSRKQYFHAPSTFEITALQLKKNLVKNTPNSLKHDQK